MALEITGLVIDRETGTPIDKAQVEAIVAIGNDTASLGKVNTDNGGFRFKLDEQQWRQWVKADPAAFVFFRVRFGDDYKRSIDTRDAIRWTADLVEILRVPVDLYDKTGSLGEVSAALDKPLPEKLLAYLAKRKIFTLADLRARGGVPIEKELPIEPRSRAIRLLNSMTALSLVDVPVPALAAFAQQGASTVNDLAVLPERDLIVALRDRSTPEFIESLRTQALFLSGEMTHRILEKRLDPSARGEADEGFADLFRLTCHCDCAAATSHQAYVAHLLRFTLRTARYNGSTFDSGFLQSYFKQPLRDLPASCESVEKKVAQARIAVEVLRAQLRDSGRATDAAASPHWYREAAYLELLQFLDVTYEELREVFKAPTNRKLGWVRRKGLGTGEPSDAQIVDDLYRDLSAALPDPAAIAESWLQQVFALRSTLANPLDPDETNPLAIDWRRQALISQWCGQDAFATRALGAIPVVDPDLISEIDLQDRTPSAPSDSFELWKPIDFLLRRRREIQAAEALIATGFGPNTPGAPGQQIRDLFVTLATSQSFIVGSTIPVPPFGFSSGADNLDWPTLLQIRNNADAGQDVSADLKRFQISEADVRVLVQYVDAMNRNVPVTDDERFQARRIVLAHVKRVGFWPVWLSQEAANLGTSGSRLALLAPGNFRERVRDTNAPDPQWQSRPRLAEPEERFLWEDMLHSRARTLENLFKDLAARVQEIESRLLPQLRNDLIYASRTGPVTLRQHLDTLTDRYQLDFEAGGCQRTTRVTQAIQTIRGLLFGLRNGLISDAAWSFGTADFDAIWRWLGTYETWRAAILAFLYPEHLLRSSLRTDMSPGCSQALQLLRDSDPVGEPEAIAAYRVFAEYLNDVASLELLAAADRPIGNRTAAYLLAVTRGRGASKFFWSVAIEQADGLGDQSWWRPIAGMKSVESVVGAALCGQFVVALTTSSFAASKSLDLWRLRLPTEDTTIARVLSDSSEWEGPFSLELPNGVNTFDSVVLVGGAAGAPVQVVIEADETIQYLRAISQDASGWTGRFRPRPVQSLWVRSGESDPYGIQPANNASFACRNNGLIDVVAEERFVLAADVDGDGADEVIAFAGPDGFWCMKQVMVGPRPTWLPLGNPSTTARFDCSFQPDFPILFFAVSGHFDGDQVAEIVAIHDARTPQGSIYTRGMNIFARKWNGGSSAWEALGATPEPGNGSQLLFLRPWDAPISCVVGRFTQVERDEILVTFRDGTSAGAITDFVVFGLVNGRWAEVTRTKIRTDIPGAAGLSGGAICAGALLGNSRHHVMLQQIEPGDIVTGRFWTLEFRNGAWRVAGTLDAGTADRAKLMVADFDGDGQNEVALAENAATVRFFKWFGSSWETGPVVTLPNPVERWAAGDFENNGTRVIVAQCTNDRRRGNLVRWDQGAIGGAVQSPDLTLGSLIPVRWIVAGRFAGRDRRAGIAALGTGCTFYTQSKTTRSTAVAPPGVQRFKPFLNGPYRLEEPQGTEFRLVPPSRVRDASTRAFQDNSTNRPRNQAYLEEGYYFLGMELTLRLQSSGAYSAARDWLDRVARLASTRLIAESYFLTLDAAGSLPQGVEPEDFDPLDAHRVARRRAGSYNRFTRLTWIRLLTDYADAEFSLATAESLSLARELYISALALLEQHPYAASLGNCAEAIAGLIAELTANAALANLIPEVREALSKLDDALRLNQAIGDIRAALASNESNDVKRASIQGVLAELAAPDNDAGTIGQQLAIEDEIELTAHLKFVAADGAKLQAIREKLTGFDWSRFKPWFVPLPQFSFCIPPSTTLVELKRRIELARNRLANCCDIAGNEMVVLPIGSGAPGSPANAAALATSLQPLPYRYQTLIERAKQLLEIARQLESTMLNYIETAERKRYDTLNARRDLALANAAERLKAVQVQQATQELGLGILQRTRSQDQVAKWSQLLRDGLSEWETAGLAAQWVAFGIKQTAAISTTVKYAASPEGWVKSIITFGGEASAAIASAQADAINAFAQTAATQAGYERRAQEWAQNLRDSLRDVQIGNQQVLVATTRVQGALAEQQIASLQTAFANQAVTFLTTKSFANEALYEWMAGVLESTYRFFLQQATQLARLAELHLAFERQEALQGLIKRDYWTRLRSGSSPDVGAVPNGTDSLRGLTGAANLLRDVYQLDQYAFLKNQRKQQLTETVSLARLDPLAFAQLVTTGRIVFETPMELFDSKLPGDYLRLIRQVRLTVIALIPPNTGIRATLSNSGVSGVVIASGDSFEKVTLRRGFEQVTYTSPVSATGQFDLNPQPELRNAFEGSGVDTRWVLDLPLAANPFRFDSIADILITLEYTALSSALWRAKVIESLPERVGAERVFSLRYDFPDAWYDLHNADPPAAPLEARFSTTRADFPPNLLRLRMTSLVLQVRFKSGVTRLDADFLTFVPSEAGAPLDGGTARLDELGNVSTRRANGSGWGTIVAGAVNLEPVGEWRLRFSPAAAGAFANDSIEDILFAVSFEGRQPPWP
jgi:receptor-binding and translocation channel-forming TcA subunit of Tc toxin/ABC toxin-like protein